MRSELRTENEDSCPKLSKNKAIGTQLTFSLQIKPQEGIIFSQIRSFFQLLVRLF